MEIAVTPGKVAPKGTEVTFTASATAAGPAPEYQWVVNSTVVSGATSMVYKTSSLKDGDSVTCRVQGTGDCSSDSINSVVMQITDLTNGVVTTITNNSDVRVIPNPNNGSFTVRGTLGVKSNEPVLFEVTDMLGKVVYRGTSVPDNGNVDARIVLSNTLANGMYMLNMSAGAERLAFHFVVKQ